MVPPIIVDYSGDIVLLPDVASAERYVEWTDVEQDNCTIYDCEGRRLGGSPGSTVFFGRLRLYAVEEEPRHAQELRVALVRYLGALRRPVTSTEHLTLAELVTIVHDRSSP